jgi:hypothetical protein
VPLLRVGSFDRSRRAASEVRTVAAITSSKFLEALRYFGVLTDVRSDFPTRCLSVCC